MRSKYFECGVLFITRIVSAFYFRSFNFNAVLRSTFENYNISRYLNASLFLRNTKEFKFMKDNILV